MTQANISSKQAVLKFFVPVVALILLVIGTLSFFKTRMEKESHTGGPVKLEVGKQIPDVTLRSFQGREVKLSAISGKIKLINFWATWCAACVVEMPSILRLKEHFKEEGLGIVFVSLDENPEEVLSDSLKKLNIDFTTYVDPEGELAEIFDITAIPLTLIVNDQLQLLHIEPGERDWNAKEVRNQVETWFKGAQANR